MIGITAKKLLKAISMTVRRSKISSGQREFRRNEKPSSIDMTYLEGTIGYIIRRAQIAIFGDIYRTFDDIRITTAEFSVLAVVADNPGVNQAELASALGVERPRMVPIINKLEKRKLAMRVIDQEDGRARVIQLTKHGQETLAELKKRFSDHQDRMLARLEVSDPKRILLDLRKLAAMDEG